MSPERAVADPEVAKLIAARARPAVLKLELAKLRTSSGILPILVFEGDDDKIVFFSWLGRIRPNLEYRMLTCRGKDQLLGLVEAVRSDATGLAKGCYFFADRDFDGLKGRAPGSDVYMAECYSVENMLVSKVVLDALLQIEFHCHASPEVRARIVKSFDSTYEQFLSATRDINRRIFLARRMKQRIKPLPIKLSGFAKLNSISDVVAVEADKVVEFVGEGADCEGELLDKEFDLLVPQLDYRGKFALLFFMRWLTLLAEERAKEGQGLFNGLSTPSAFRTNEISLVGLAAKSEIPAGLAEFVAAIEPAGHA